MGFCLLKQADVKNLYFAVNTAHVKGLTEMSGGYRIDLHKGNGMILIAAGNEDAIKRTLYEAAKIGVGKVSATILAGKGNRVKPMAFYLNATDRIVAVRELQPEEFINEDAEHLTASILLFEDGTERMIVERPGIFAKKANKGGMVPTLKA